MLDFRSDKRVKFVYLESVQDFVERIQREVCVHGDCRGLPEFATFKIGPHSRRWAAGAAVGGRNGVEVLSGRVVVSWGWGGLWLLGGDDVHYDVDVWGRNEASPLATLSKHPLIVHISLDVNHVACWKQDRFLECCRKLFQFIKKFFGLIEK